ncbi:MAG: sucA [Rickettsiaceae bacterium]|jgi:2-oxoglutarate dehydrogenase E1 component|nr:sucA [Rickettsiaceae bacterium]
MGKNKFFEETSFLFGANAVFIEELYEKYLQDNSSVSEEWRHFFANYTNERAGKPSWPHQRASVILGPEKEEIKATKGTTVQTNNLDALAIKLTRLVAAYRERGHFLAKLDPLGLEKLPTAEELCLNKEFFGITAEELNQEASSKLEVAGETKYKTQDLIDKLTKIYASRIGLETNHIDDFEQKQWLYKEIEQFTSPQLFSQDEKKQILQDLVETEGFEQYLHTKFPGAKRFSIEGGDSYIAAMSASVEFAGRQGIENIVIGMAHRGRLNTLTKVMGKPYSALMYEFKGASAFPAELGIAGDVKYHMGYSKDYVTKDGKQIHLSLAPNPSHLEAVNPVVTGKVRAKQDAKGDHERKGSLAILVHGDAAFAGQGVVAETLMTSSLKPYTVGGTLHFVINNQVGFTANPEDSRPGRYATDIAKIVGAPIFHVSGDDPEAVIFATKLALAFRNEFSKDAVVDIVCYRKYGHNEGDEPMFTQSIMYNIIKAKPTPGQLYATQLLAEGIIQPNEFEERKAKFKAYLDGQFEEAKSFKPEADHFKGQWQGMIMPKDSREHTIVTGLDVATLKTLGIKLCEIPTGFNVNSKIEKLLKDRRQALETGAEIDWATAEQLAFASLLVEGYKVRITGQDAGRGTFSHRHSVLHDQVNGNKYLPLNNLKEGQACYEVADSNLSEYAVLGFEYGYASENPKNLVLWEAQFGDFANGAQIMFDQFISATETKWLRMNGIVCLLPHGYEGQGPEHSSARLERFLQLAAEDNIQVVNPTLPASFFHLLRRQMLRNFRKPLIVMTPKSLLRHKLAVSKLEDLGTGTQFKPVIDEVNSNIQPAKVEKVIICSGKVYYELYEKREEKSLLNIAIIRIEQYYPFPEKELVEVLTKYSSAKEVIWTQEEPENMGAWMFIRPLLQDVLAKISYKGNSLKYVGRKASASTAVGYLSVHQAEQSEIIKKSLNLGE